MSLNIFAMDLSEIFIWDVVKKIGCFRFLPFAFCLQFFLGFGDLREFTEETDQIEKFYV